MPHAGSGAESNGAETDAAAVHQPQSRSWDRAEVSRNLLAGLTTSFAAIALGAAFGATTGRGALVGALSAGLIPVLTSALGGTRIQVSGPTTPMSAVVADVVVYSRSQMLNDITHPMTHDSPGCGVDNYSNALCPIPDRFVNIVLLLCGILVMLMGLFKAGRYITLVPAVVVSGFQNGIALHMWRSQLLKIPKLRGSLWLNAALAVLTTALCFLLPRLIKRLVKPRIARVIPATLCVIAFVTVLCLPFPDCPKPCDGCSGCLEKTQLGAPLRSGSDVLQLLRAHTPTVQDIMTEGLLVRALRYGAELAVLCFIDTLLTSLVVDKMVNEETNRRKELGAQGLGNCVVALFGGLPGAQSTSRSVLVLQEGGTMRLAGIATGLFVLAELLVLQSVVELIPAAVFCGVLISVGWKLFDHGPVRRYVAACAASVRNRRAQSRPLRVEEHGERDGGDAVGPVPSHLEMLFISGTAVVTVLASLNVAVASWTALFHAAKYLAKRDRRFHMSDLQEVDTDEAKRCQTRAAGMRQGTSLDFMVGVGSE